MRMSGQYRGLRRKCGSCKLQPDQCLLPDCHRSRTPVVAIAAPFLARDRLGIFQNPSRAAFREVLQLLPNLFSTAKQMPRAPKCRTSFDSMSGRVSVIVIPGGRRAQDGGERVRAVTMGLRAGAVDCRASSPTPPNQSSKAGALLNKGRRVTLLCGSGCGGSMTTDATRRSLKAPISTPCEARKCRVGKSLRRGRPA